MKQDYQHIFAAFKQAVAQVDHSRLCNPAPRTEAALMEHLEKTAKEKRDGNN